MHAPKSVALTALSALVSTAASTTTEPQKLGLIGPENMMLFLNGFHFISGEPNHYLQANHHCVLMSPDFSASPNSRSRFNDNTNHPDTNTHPPTPQSNAPSTSPAPTPRASPASSTSSPDPPSPRCPWQSGNSGTATSTK